jgi:predicted CopG family antitoxin
MADRKTISLTEGAYDALEAEKREGESFTDVVRRLTAETGTTQTPNRVAVANVDEIARRAATEVENRMTTR